VQDLIASAGNITDTIINFNDKFTFMGVYLADSPADYKEVGAKILLIPLLSGLTALMSAVFMYMKQKKNNPEMAKNPSMGCMTFMSPMMSVVFTFMFPAGVGVYWIMTNIITFVQTVVLNYTHSPRKVIAQTMVEETVLRRSRENVIKMRAQMEK
ncbi:MAG: YidC/Oxa1 family membrane protein insertase, partial [Clostridiales bacterium]|nr:YidC/Oxa1 family membrane protein insertase [Clostridiales bacterium]